MNTDSDRYSAGDVARSIGRNTMFGMVSNFTQVATRLFTVPVVIHYLGLGGYGIWNVIMMTATYMRFGSVGVRTAFQKYVAESTGDGNYDRANQLLSTGTVIMLVLSVCGLVPAALFSSQIAMFVGVPACFLRETSGAISLLALIMLMANVGAAFEAIVMGAHRIDLVRMFRTALTIMEAVAIILALYLGGGLFAMACVMGASELIYILCCYTAARRVVPQIRIRFHHFTTGVFYELLRFGGSYQIVNVLEVLYAAIVPFAILRAFGATSAGVYAVVNRVVTSASFFQEAFLPPILSGGAMIYASESAERMQIFVTKAFKASMGLSLFPLGFISVFGTLMAYAWTGETEPSFRAACWLLSLTTLFAAISRLAFVLYRISGRALLDNVWQCLRIVLIVASIACARQLGFLGVLEAVALVELIGMLFMMFALTRAYHLFRAVLIIPDAIRMTATLVLILLAGVIASHIPALGNIEGRAAASVKLVEAFAACLIVAWPLGVRTGVITPTEKVAFANSLFVDQRQCAKVLKRRAEV
jgi:O-antigen/teichoic acid export membrane protein